MGAENSIQPATCRFAPAAPVRVATALTAISGACRPELLGPLHASSDSTTCSKPPEPLHPHTHRCLMLAAASAGQGLRPDGPDDLVVQLGAGGSVSRGANEQVNGVIEFSAPTG